MPLNLISYTICCQTRITLRKWKLSRSFSKRFLRYLFNFDRLELNGDRCRLTWEATPISIYEGVSSAFYRSDCLKFDDSTAQNFVEKGNLPLNVAISVVESNSKS